jgi:hypothetical protein
VEREFFLSHFQIVLNPESSASMTRVGIKCGHGATARAYVHYSAVHFDKTLQLFKDLSACSCAVFAFVIQNLRLAKFPLKR